VDLRVTFPTRATRGYHLTFCISFLLLALCSLRLSARLASSPADRYWIFIATATLQLGMITSLTSSVHQLRPAAWVVVQILICAVTLRFTGGLRPLNLQRVSVEWRNLLSVLGTFVTALSTSSATALIVIIGILGLSAFAQVATPIYAGDEKMYHASRVIYWIQHQTVFPFVTHNDRQTLIPFGSELLFLWPVLLTRSELVGRLVFWSAFPCAAIGQYLLLRAMKLSCTVALVGVLILMATPLVAASAIGLKPELWSIVTLLGASYWVVSICLDPQRMATKCFFLGVFTMLSVNVRPFPVAIVPSVILIPLWTRSSFAPVSRVKAVAAGLACGGILSAFVIPFGFNLARYHHPLGPAGVRHVVIADVTPRQIYTHAVRFPFLLLELPDAAASAETRAQFGKIANQFISAVGAGALLPMEGERPWPGRFSYSLPEQSVRFSVWGLLWIPTLVIAALLLIRNVLVTWPSVKLAAVPAQTLLALPLLTAVLFGARWMTQSEVPTRYLIGPYALTIPIGIAISSPYIRGKKLAESLALIAVAVSLYQPMRLQIYNAVQAITAPITEKDIDQPFEEALDVIPDRSRIVFVGQQDSPDYPLFSPGTHYSNAVTPWGKTPFDPARMRLLIDSQKATHVLIQHDETATFLSDPDIRTGEMVAWLAREPGLKEIPLSTPHMRLFETDNSTESYERPFQTTAVPSSAPLIRVGSTLRRQIGIDPTFLKTPWRVEIWSRGGFLWMGQGREEGVEFGLWSRGDRAVDLRFDVGPGPSVTAPDRTVMLLQDGAPVGDRRFQGDTAVVFHVRLHAGRNLIEFVALDAATVMRMPNGDPRHLVVMLRHVQAESALEPADDAAQQGSSEATGLDGSRAPNGDLAQRARRAAAVVISRQQLRGYWLTSYTGETRFDRPQMEMNTFVTSIMIDVLNSAAAATGLGESLQRARQHLAGQIEAGGLVRYHGRPDAPTIGALGCVITPDADDTALVWRIAPGAHPELLPTALETLKRYRTPDGLYRTWLGPRDQYQCIDAGQDPDPADVAIQMHVLMLLAKADSAAAHTLCGALRQAIDEDRIWVYYRRAPLVPILRQADLQLAGCSLQLPPSRTRAAVPGQEVWIAAAQLMRRMLGTKSQLPNSVEVLDLLRRLSRDDFASLRLSPPLVYHNDLTASVRRFYWSEEFGYALWLRLYVESERHGFLRPGRGNDANAGGLR
jgi:hypothetical protein